MTEYKPSEIGDIPIEWEAKKLIELAEKEADIVGGPFGSNLKVSDYRETGVPIIRLQNIERNKFLNKDIKFVSDEKAEELNYHSFEPKDIVLAKLGDPIGKTCIVPDYMKKGIVTADVVRIRTELSLTNKQYLVFALNTNICEEQFRRQKSGTTRPRVNVSDVRNIIIPHPPLSEQQNIASVLSAVLAAKEKTENVINALKELKKSMMKHLFTYGPVSVEDAEKVTLKETEIGVIPEHWYLDCLGNLVDVRGGKRLPKGHSFAEDVTPFPYIRIVDFAKSSVRLSNLKYLTQMDRETIKRYIIEKEDVYISIAGTIGLVGTVPKGLDGANLTENAARLILRDSKQINKIYLVDFLASECGQNEIHKRTTKTSQPKLALTRIKEIPVAIPSYAEQQQITDILSAMDIKIEAEENKKEALEILFKTLLSLLMTGKIRVKDLEIPV